MPHDLTLEGQVQAVLNEMWSEDLISFALNVERITKTTDEYVIQFYDSGIHSARVPLTKGLSLKFMVRSAVLSCLSEMSGP